MRQPQRPANVSYYARNRDLERHRVRTRQADTVAFLRDLRRSPCVDCRGRFAPHQLDFDHRDPAAKSFRLTSGRAMLKPQRVLEAEAAKCDVVCANCHRIRNHEASGRPACAARYIALPRAKEARVAPAGPTP